MEECNLSDADTDELLGLSGIEPFASGGSVYLTPSKSPPGSPTDLLTTSPKRRAGTRSSASLSPSRKQGSQPSPTRAICNGKSPKRGVKKFGDSPGKLTLGDLKRKEEVNITVRQSSRQEYLVKSQDRMQDRIHDSRKVDTQNKENLLELSGGASKKINSAPTSCAKSSQNFVGVKSLPSSPQGVFAGQNFVVTSHNPRHNQTQLGIDRSGPNVGKVPPAPVDPIYTYKRKLFQEEDNPNQKLNQTQKDKAGVKNRKANILKDQSPGNKKTVSPKKKSPKENVVHSGSPTQSTHSASKYKVSPRGGGGGKSPGKQRVSRSLDNSPDKRPSSIMKGGGSVSPGRRPGPVTFRRSPPESSQAKSASPKYVKSSPPKNTNPKRYTYTEQSGADLRYGHDSVLNKPRASGQYSPEKYENKAEKQQGYYSGKPAFNRDGYSNPLDEVLQQYPLSPNHGEAEMSLPDSPGMKAAADTIGKFDDYDHIPKEEYAEVTSFDIEEMEGARDSLRTMLKLSTKNPELRLNLGGNVQNESISTFRSYPDEHEDTQQNDSFEEVATKALMGGGSEIDYDQALQLTSQLLGRDKDTRGLPDSALEMENQVLLDNLDREKFRRQHCEKQIGNLQSRLLETQEQLAVAISTEKKKDIMIEQLDKTLSRVVEGWKKREAEKKELLEAMKKEKEDFESRYQNQKDLLEKFEDRLQKASSKLEAEQRKCAELEENKLAKHEDERQQWAEAVDTERIQREQAEDDRDRAREGLDHVQAQLDNLQITLNQEREEWSESENNLQKKIQDLEETYKNKIENEKRQVEEQTHIADETQEKLTSATGDLHKTRLELEVAMRERDNLKMELSLLEARMESSKRQLEAELTSDFEKALSDKMNEAHERLVNTETDLREGHRKQIQELNQRHSDDLEEQRDTMNEDFKKKEAYLKEQAKTYEERLEEVQEEVRELKANKHKMELQREREDYHDRYASGERKIEMASRMQSMMQTHCSEALTLLNNSSRSPPRPYQHESVLSHIPSMTKPPSGLGVDHHPCNTIVDEDDDGAISDVLSTEGDPNMPPLSSVPVCAAPSSYVPPFSMSQFSQQPISDITSLDSNRSSNFGSASQVPSNYPYSSVYQTYAPVSSQQHSSAYSHSYEPTNHSMYTASSNSTLTSMQPPHQPVLNNYTHLAANGYSNQPNGNMYAKPMHSYQNPPNTGYPVAPVHQQMVEAPAKRYQLPGEPLIQSTYNSLASEPPQAVNESVSRADYSHLFNGNGNVSEPSAPSLSSGYSSMANHFFHYSDPAKPSEPKHDVRKDETADMVSLLNGSTATHNDTCVSDISQRMEQHNQRQQELEHYVRVLLGKEPGRPVEDEIVGKNHMVPHSPPQKLLPDSTQPHPSHPNDNAGDEGRLVSTNHAPKYGSVMGLAREKLHVKKKGQVDPAAERKSSVRKSRDGPIGKSSTAKPWR